MPGGILDPLHPTRDWTVTVSGAEMHPVGPMSLEFKVRAREREEALIQVAEYLREEDVPYVSLRAGVK